MAEVEATLIVRSGDRRSKVDEALIKLDRRRDVTGARSKKLMPAETGTLLGAVWLRSRSKSSA